MIELVQIGDIPLRGISLETTPYEMDTRPKDDPESTLTDGGVAFPFLQYANRLNERELDGLILRKLNVDVFAMYDELNSIVGKPTHVVGVYPLKGCYGIDAIWLFAQGSINRLRGEPDEFGNMRVRLELALTGYWKPLNRLLWEYVDFDRSGLYSGVTPSTPSSSLVNSYPTWEEYLLETRSLFSWYWRYISERSTLMYDPDYWGLIVNEIPNGFVNLGEYEGWSNSQAIITIWQDATVWNHRPMVTYAIKGMDTSNDVTLEIYRPDYLGGDEIITIDVSELDTILTNETATGLQTTDILLMGDVGGRAFVVRGGMIVAYCTSAISPYYGEIIGSIQLNENIEFRINYDFSSNIEWAYLIQWRKMS